MDFDRNDIDIKKLSRINSICKFNNLQNYALAHLNLFSSICCLIKVM